MSARAGKYVINASNLHAGGGIQVAVSLIWEFSLVPNFSRDLSVLASREVDANLMQLGCDVSKFAAYEIFDVYGIESMFSALRSKLKGFSVVVTVFGPLYVLPIPAVSVVGFAQPWIIHPENEISRIGTLRSRLLLRLKFAVYWGFFCWSASRLVVELQHVKDGLVSFKRYPAERIDVVSNCVSSIYFEKSKWASLPDLSFQDEVAIKIGYVSRAYPHKNIMFLLQVSQEIENLGGVKVKFYVTLSEDEWAGFSDEFRDVVVNMGPLSVAQCPTFYQAMDAVIFTSFLECFSATPLEALVMRRPLFASNRKFVRDCCSDHAVYVDPTDAIQTASAIRDWYTEIPEGERARRVEAAYQHVLTLPDSRDRARGYIDIIKSQL